MKHKIKTNKSKWKIKKIEGKTIKKRYNKKHKRSMKMKRHTFVHNQKSNKHIKLEAIIYMQNL